MKLTEVLGIAAVALLAVDINLQIAGRKKSDNAIRNTLQKSIEEQKKQRHEFEDEINRQLSYVRCYCQNMLLSMEKLQESNEK